MKNIILLFIIFFISSCGQDEPVKETLIPKIAWMEVKLTGVEQTRKLSGQLNPREGAALSFNNGGYVTDVKVDLGTKVKKGQVLARLSQRDAKSLYLSSQADYVNKESYYNRMKVARESKAVSQQDVSDAKTELEIAASNLAINKKGLEDTVLRAPYDGIITFKDVDEAQQVYIGETLFKIDSGEGLEVSVFVPETLIKKLVQDKIYTVTFPAARGLEMKGVLKEIGTQATRANSFPVVLYLTEQSSELRAGMTAEVLFVYYQDVAESILIPNSALGVGNQQSSFVYVYDQSTSRLKKVTVKPLNITNNDVYVQGNIKSGDIIAVAGVPYLRDNQEVILQEQDIEIFNFN
jgi:RND family efflux transporter MFP subunit